MVKQKRTGVQIRVQVSEVVAEALNLHTATHKRSAYCAEAIEKALRRDGCLRGTGESMRVAIQNPPKEGS